LGEKWAAIPEDIAATMLSNRVVFDGATNLARMAAVMV